MFDRIPSIIATLKHKAGCPLSEGALKHFVFLVVSALLLQSTAIAQTTQPDQQITFSDGSAASAYDHCGDTDLCASVIYQNGDHLSIYSEGAAYCQPYILHFVLVNGDRTIYEYSRAINHDLPTTSAFGTRCGNSQNTQMVLDHGFIHMTVSENHDGTLSIRFSLTKKGNALRNQAPEPSPSASP
jgi:hypothetical protein